jgi:predicted ATPase
MPGLSFKVSAFRALRVLDWSPRGVCVLSGANGAGKTSTLSAMIFLRNAILRGVQEAARFAAAGSAFRNLASAPTEDVVFEVTDGAWRWRLSIPVEGDGVHAYNGEQLWKDEELVLDVPRLQSTFALAADGTTRNRQGAEINTYFAVRPDPSLGAFIEQIKALRFYDDFALFRGPPAQIDPTHVFLHPDGRNLVSVLNNWKRAPRRYNDQFAWVLGWARRAFPDLVADLEFPPEGGARFYPPNGPTADASLPLNVAADGLITGLMQLTAVAGAKPGSTIGFDEMENQLHPHAIRTILEAMRERAEENGLNIVLTTHSPVVLNAFADAPEQIHVVSPTATGANPVPLSQLKAPEWLGMFSLGNLYERERFAAPTHREDAEDDGTDGGDAPQGPTTTMARNPKVTTRRRLKVGRECFGGYA